MLPIGSENLAKGHKFEEKRTLNILKLSGVCWNLVFRSGLKTIKTCVKWTFACDNVYFNMGTKCIEYDNHKVHLPNNNCSQKVVKSQCLSCFSTKSYNEKPL